jgi:hypothetical protein
MTSWTDLIPVVDAPQFIAILNPFIEVTHSPEIVVDTV